MWTISKRKLKTANIPARALGILFGVTRRIMIRIWKFTLKTCWETESSSLNDWRTQPSSGVTARDNLEPASDCQCSVMPLFSLASLLVPGWPAFFGWHAAYTYTWTYFLNWENLDLGVEKGFFWTHNISCPLSSHVQHCICLSSKGVTCVHKIVLELNKEENATRKPSLVFIFLSTYITEVPSKRGMWAGRTCHHCFRQGTYLSLSERKRISHRYLAHRFNP